jgi:hypothetical protein
MKTRRRGGVKCPACGKEFKRIKGETCAKCTHKKQLPEDDLRQVFQDIQYFKTAGVGKGSNDSLNNKRENVLRYLYNPPAEFLDDPYWREMNTKWKMFLQTLCNQDYDDVIVERKGGRKYNYDLEIQFQKDKKTVCSVKAEFKHNSKSIDGLPEYFSPAANKPYFAVTYGDYFYDNYVDKVCSLTEQARLLKPTKTEYIKFLYQNEYKKNQFFSCLYESETDATFYGQKQEIVKESIDVYLRTYISSLDKALLSKDIKERQSGKVFILWDLKDFRSDSIREDEMEIVSASEIKNKNTIIAVSKAGTKHHMLLRWKNHQGILYPAWQVKLSR